MTIRLPEDLEPSVRDQVARGHFPSEDAFVAEVVRVYLQDRWRETSVDDSVHDLLTRSGLIGCLKGSPEAPDDLATNPVHMEGFGG